MNSLGQELREGRKKVKMTLMEASKVIGRCHMSIKRLEEDEVPHPRPVELRRLARAYRLKFTHLMQKAGYLRSNEAIVPDDSVKPDHKHKIR